MQTYTTDFHAMGCENQIVLHAADKSLATLGLAAAVDEVRRIERKYSRYLPATESIVTRINERAGAAGFVACDAETRRLFDIAAKAYEHSNGLFDITSGVLRRAWNFKDAVLPEAAQVTAVLSHVGWTRVERSSDGVRLAEAGMEIDFGGFGKEYAADCAMHVLKAQGFTSGFVNLGGDIAVLGPQPDGSPWLFGIQNPKQRGVISAKIPMVQGGLATSGDYEKFMEKDGRRYSHILNPMTGMPVNCWSSVSVVHVSALGAGIFSTIAMLKEEGAVPFLRNAGVPYLLIGVDGGVQASASSPRRSLNDNGFDTER